MFICEHSSMSDGDQAHHVTTQNWMLGWKNVLVNQYLMNTSKNIANLISKGVEQNKTIRNF